MRFWLAVYNLRANGGCRNIIAFSYAGCCLYQMEKHIHRVWVQTYSVWLWLYYLMLMSNSELQHWTGRRTGGGTCFGSVCLCTCQCLHILVFAHVCLRHCHSVAALWLETMVLSAACCCWQAPTLYAMRRTAVSWACWGVSHVPVVPPLLLLLFMCRHTDTNLLSLLYSCTSC